MLRFFLYSFLCFFSFQVACGPFSSKVTYEANEVVWSSSYGKRFIEFTGRAVNSAASRNISYDQRSFNKRLSESYFYFERIRNSEGDKVVRTLRYHAISYPYSNKNMFIRITCEYSKNKPYRCFSIGPTSYKNIKKKVNSGKWYRMGGRYE